MAGLVGIRITVVGMLLAAIMTTAASAAPATDVASPPAGEIGSVDTLAGPQFCAGPAQVDAESVQVRALAVGPAGEVFVSTGRASDGLVAVVDDRGRPSVVRTGVPAGAGMLASDGAGGFVLAAGVRVEHWGEQGRVVLAGDPIGQPGPAGGDGGPAQAARFAAVSSLTTDEVGNVYVADTLDEDAGTVRIRFINRSDEPVTMYPGTGQELTVPPGHIDTIAGGQGARGDGDGGSALAATVSGQPPAMAVTAGRVYVASHDAAPNRQTVRVRMLNLGGTDVVAHGVRVPAGGIQTVAGGGPPGYSGDGVPARRASLGRLNGIAVDDAGNLYLADSDHHRIRKVDVAGVLTTFAGTGPRNQGGFDGNDQLATQARLDAPFDVEVGPDGRVYITDRGNGQVRYVDEDGIIQAAPGNGVGLGWVCEATAAIPQAGMPASVATDGAGNAYVVVEGFPHVLRVDPKGTVTPVLGGGPDASSCPPEDTNCPAEDGAPATEARVERPMVVATSGDGSLYLVDDGRLLLANVGESPLRAHGLTVPAGALATVVDDVRAANSTQDKGEAESSGRNMSALPGLTALGVDPDRTVYVADPVAHAVLGLAARSQEQEAAGTAFVPVVEPQTSRSAAPAEQCCREPSGVAVDEAGNLYISDIASRRVWYHNLGSAPITVLGREVQPSTSEPVAGSGERGFGGDGGPAVDAAFQGPTGLALDGDGNLYIADAAEHTVRKVDRTGTISTVAGTGSPGFNGDGLQGGLTMLSSPRALTIDRCGNLLIADAGNSRLRRLNLAGPCARLAAGGTPPADPDGSGRWRSLALLAPLALAGVGITVALGRGRARR